MMKSNMMKTALAALGVAVLGIAGAHAAVYTQSVDIYQNTTWSNGDTYVLTQPVFVTNGAELTIQQGVVVRGEQAVSTDPGALIICRNSKIHADGVATNPIVFTDKNDDNIGASYGSGDYASLNNGKAEQWGGLLVLGNTYIASNASEPTNSSPHSSITLQIEGLEPYGDDSRYGGGDDDDDSGEISYVSIRYGGYVLGDANEINGLTLGAVGRETDIDHVEVFQNKDDGIEFFGGTVNTKYMLVWMVGDDSYDYDEGFRGKGQFWAVVQGPLSGSGDKSDKGSEQDGAMGDSSQPSSMPTIYNATMVGHGVGTSTKNTALHFRDGTGGRWFNGLFMDFGGACALIEGETNNSSRAAYKFTQAYTNDAGGYYTHEEAGTRQGDLLNNSFWSFGSNGIFGCAANTTGLAGVWGAEHGGTKTDGNKAHYGLEIFGASYSWMNNDMLTGTNVPVKDITRSATAVNIDGTDYYPVESLDPTLNTTAYSTLLEDGRVPPRTDSFFTPVNFRGAFADERNWAGPWSLASRLGGIYATTEGDYTGLVPDIYVGTNGEDSVDGSVTVAPLTTVQVKAKLNVDVYQGERADYFIACLGPNNVWYWYSVPNNRWGAGWNCGWQNATLNNYAESTLFNTSFPFPGTYTFYYLVELNNNGQWDATAPYFYDSITVNVSW